MTRAEWCIRLRGIRCPDGHREPPSGVVLVGGDGDGLDCAIRDLMAAGVPYHAVEDPGRDRLSIPSNSDPRLWCWSSPGADDAPEASVDLVLRALLRIHEHGIEARLWVGTTGVYGGSNISHAPLWGLSRVAAAEHPQVWGGVLDVADGRFPLDVLGSLHGHGVIVMRDGVPHAARLASPSAVGPESAARVGVFSRRHLPDHRRHRGARVANGAAARRPWRATSAAVVPFWRARPRNVG